MNTHLTNNELLEYTDGLTDSLRSLAADEHLRACPRCSSRLQMLRRLERAVRKIPSERVSESFTQRVMVVVGLGRSSFARQLFANFLPLAIAIVVIAALVGVFAGEPSQDPVSLQGSEVVQTLGQHIGEILSTGTSVMFDWTMKLVGISAAVPSIKLVIGLLLAFALIALFDEFVFLPMMKKRN
jgi:predicted anti-sigma-YlaC factor YlaD